MAQEKQPERSMEARVGRDNQRYGPRGERLVAGVVPLSQSKDQVLLIQSSSRKGWVLPKGGWEADEPSEAEAACREAWEEAGIHSAIERDLGFVDEKRTDEQIKKGGPHAPRALYRWFEVRVTKEEETWPEAHKRSRMWMSYAEARSRLADRPELLEALERSSIKKT
ncbi:hypothetical protein B0A48_06311 [Cryoendolithus antarcticus]|uniref:Nudix hydrolase domain-containing protein n=1 Tax=Cryoendolithus antarcticus TaxID=1507870 RepID=A0A1V8TB08_9PEZI|nr:hypothetical protein B0A48_06311 [Cryoendolithus antarcticus]OQO26647.1 hypothetical protein B0A51_04124 [Rachicladosporium sp. CCFEE 5018]